MTEPQFQYLSWLMEQMILHHISAHGNHPDGLNLQRGYFQEARDRCGVPQQPDPALDKLMEDVRRIEQKRKAKRHADEVLAFFKDNFQCVPREADPHG